MEEGVGVQGGGAGVKTYPKSRSISSVTTVIWKSIEC